MFSNPATPLLTLSNLAEVQSLLHLIILRHTQAQPHEDVDKVLEFVLLAISQVSLHPLGVRSRDPQRTLIVEL